MAYVNQNEALDVELREYRNDLKRFKVRLILVLLMQQN